MMKIQFTTKQNRQAINLLSDVSVLQTAHVCPAHTPAASTHNGAVHGSETLLRSITCTFGNHYVVFAVFL